jgi:hypothetical protein
MSAKLVPFRYAGSAEMRYWLEARLAEALEEHLIGIAAICMYRGNDYAISIKGEIRRVPIITRGLLPEVDYELARIIRGK